MIDFACKRFELREVVKCGLNLTSSEFEIFSFFMKSKDFLSTLEISQKTGFDLSTIQRAVKKLYEKELLFRQQKNLDRGYAFYYKIKSKSEINRIIMSIIHNWIRRVEKELNNL